MVLVRYFLCVDQCRLMLKFVIVMMVLLFVATIVILNCGFLNLVVSDGRRVRSVTNGFWIPVGDRYHDFLIQMGVMMNVYLMVSLMMVRVVVQVVVDVALIVQSQSLTSFR